jgi:hypothetical protein
MPDAPTRHDIELLVDEAHLDLIVTQWPLPRAAVVHALDRLPADLPPSQERARDRVRRAIGVENASQATVRLLSRGDALAGYGDDSTRGSSIAARSDTVGNDYVAGRIGVRADAISGLQEQGRLRLEDSALVTEAFGIELQAFSRRNWWGPGWQSSLTLSNNAPAFNGFGLQRASGSRSESPWLSWLGPWNYDMFIGRTEDGPGFSKPYFFGQRLTFKPFSLLEIGLTRTAQWGGQGREQTFRSFLHMLTGKDANADTSAQLANDPANEEAGFDFRLRCPSGLRCATYLQLTGEDQAGVMPSKFLGLYGVEWWSADGDQRYFLEYAETGCRSPIGRPFVEGCAYRNTAYPQGYTNDGRWIGSSAGPDSRIVTLGWSDVALGASVRLSAGKVGSRIGTFSPEPLDPTTSGRLISVAARKSISWGGTTLTPELDWFHVAAPDGGTHQLRIGATVTIALDDVLLRR